MVVNGSSISSFLNAARVSLARFAGAWGFAETDDPFAITRSEFVNQLPEVTTFIESAFATEVKSESC